MKKAIFSFVLIASGLFAFAQEKPKQASKSDTVYVDLSKAKIIVMMDSLSAKQPVKMLDAKAIAENDLVIAPKQYWYSLMMFMKGAKNGNFSQQEVESIQQPFYQYALDWERIVQNFQKK